MDKMSSPEEREQLYSNNTDENFFDTSDVASSQYDGVNGGDPGLNAEERARLDEEYKQELAKLDDEILTLRQVLSAKVRQSSELKRKLGITPMSEFKKDMSQGLSNIKESDAYQKTSTGVSHTVEKVTATNAYQKTSGGIKVAGQKTATAMSAVGQFTAGKFRDARNSASFKSFEEKVGGAVGSVKSRMRGSQSEQNFEDALNSTVESRVSASTPSTPMQEQVPL